MIGTSWRHVENIAADDVADREVGLAVEDGTHRHRHLGRAGAERDDGESHDQRRNAGRQRQLGRSTHQQRCATDECRQSKQEE
jgi:hypothetical protein